MWQIQRATSTSICTGTSICPVKRTGTGTGIGASIGTGTGAGTGIGNMVLVESTCERTCTISDFDTSTEGLTAVPRVRSRETIKNNVVLKNP